MLIEAHLWSVGLMLGSGNVTGHVMVTIPTSSCYTKPVRQQQQPNTYCNR